jgi:hypothetical protein
MNKINFDMKKIALLIFIIMLLPVYLDAQSSIKCKMFPDDNIWNTPIDNLKTDVNSALYIQTIGETKTFHADFGSGLWNGGTIGIPYVTVSGSQKKVNVTFDYPDESDKGPYPIPDNPPIEGGNASTGDRHILIVDNDNCILYELYSAYPQNDGTWRAGSGAIYNLNSDALRTKYWTSADAAGLPILPGLVRYDEVASGEIKHAIRFTVPQTRKSFLWPARHYASSITDAKYPPMGLRLRLKKDYDVSKYPKDVRVILSALKKYGMILADNGSAWYISGVPDERWNNDSLHTFSLLKGSDFEAVDESSLITDENSGKAKQISTDVRIINPSSMDNKLLQNYPNPFNPATTIEFYLSKSEKVSLKVYDVLGRELTTLIDDLCAVGRNTVVFNAVNISSGIYYYELVTSTVILRKTMFLLK